MYIFQMERGEERTQMERYHFGKTQTLTLVRTSSRPLKEKVLINDEHCCFSRLVARETEAYLEYVNGADICGGYPGEGEERLRKIFDKALDISEEGPCVLFIDEIDALCPQRSEHSLQLVVVILLRHHLSQRAKICRFKGFLTILTFGFSSKV